MNEEPNNKSLQRAVPVRWRLIFTLVFGIAALPLFYSNCSSQHTGLGSNSSASTSAYLTCSLTGAQQLFQLTYYPFLQTNCSSCHSATGEASDTPFGDTNLVTAYASFMSETAQGTDLTKIDTYAVAEPDNTHVPPSAGPQFATQINDLGATPQSQWEVGMNELTGCGTTQFLADQYQATRSWSVSKPVGFMSGTQIGTVFADPTAVTQTVDWDLDSSDGSTDMISTSNGSPSPVGTCASTSNALGCWPSLPGAHFEIDLQAFATGDETEYVIRNPRIVYPTMNSNAVNFTVHSLQIKINGQVVVNETTFLYVVGAAYKNQTDYLSVGAMAYLTNIRQSDVISMSFGDMDATTQLPALPPPPSVSFNLATDSVTQPTGLSNPAAKSVQIQISNPTNEFINVPLEISAEKNGDTYVASPDAVPPITMMTIPGVTGANNQPLQVPSFLIDYQVASDGISPLTGPKANTKNADEIDMMVTILPETTGATLNFSILPSDRYENNGANTRVLMKMSSSNSLGSLTTGVTTGTSTYTLTINQSNPQPAANAVTLTQLMSPGGAFYENCVECHYPNPAAVPPFSQPMNNYSMTVYSSLMSDNHFVPGNPTNSIAWQLINGPVPPSPQMPIDGSLPSGSTYYEQIYNWIMAGAKND